MVVVAWLFWYFFVGNPFDELALIQRGRTVSGFIVDTWENAESGDSGGTQWFHAVIYKYRLPDGREFTRRTKERSGRLKDEFRVLTQPYPVEVEYLPDKPLVSRLKGDGSDSMFDWLWRNAGLGSVLLVVFLGPGIVMLRNGFRDIRKLHQSENERHP